MPQSVKLGSTLQPPAACSQPSTPAPLAQGDSHISVSLSPCPAAKPAATATAGEGRDAASASLALLVSSTGWLRSSPGMLSGWLRRGESRGPGLLAGAAAASAAAAPCGMEGGSLREE